MLHEPFSQPDPLRDLSDDELSGIVERCESVIADGSAAIDDYEAFVLAQKELARRTWA